MATGSEMLLVTMLKTFVPKEAAEEIANFLERAIQDGTFTHIARLPQELAEIKASLARLEASLRSDKPEGGNAVSGPSSGSGPSESAFAEYGGGKFARPSDTSGANGASHTEHGGSVSAA